MTHQAARTLAQRKLDTLARLARPAEDAWVATASAGADGPEAHLVPLSLAWIDGCVVIALPGSSPTARNIRQHGIARLALGPTRDVVVIDAELEFEHEVASAPAQVAEGYAAQADWDPRQDAGSYVYLTLRPTRIQAWRESNEMKGRVLMRDGAWLE